MFEWNDCAVVGIRTLNGGRFAWWGVGCRSIKESKKSIFLDYLSPSRFHDYDDDDNGGSADGFILAVIEQAILV